MVRDKSRIAVIGAGMTAASFVWACRGRAVGIDIFEKSRGAGGRMATRRFDGPVSADHGAQYFTSHTTQFDEFIGEMVRSGSVSQWAVRDDTPCHIGVPHMNSPIKEVLAAARLRPNQLVTSIERREGDWFVKTSEGAFGPYDYIVSTVPAPQAKAIAAQSGLALDEAFDTVEIAPCWALMLVFDEPVPAPFKSWRGDHSVAGWMGRNSTKDGRDFKEDSWTIHATADWSQRFLELSPGEATDILYQSFIDVIGSPTRPPIHQAAHRWRYAQTTKPLGEPYLNDMSRSVFFGGDWCLGARVECAFESGCAMTRTIIEQND